MPEARGLTFYQILTLASIVEREAVVDEERPLIAGVFQNRLHKLRGIAPVLASDPTVFYAVDTMKLAKLPFDQWKTYFFWNVPGAAAPRHRAPARARSATRPTRRPGLPPGPIARRRSPRSTRRSTPTRRTGYLYFLAKKDGSNTHAFAKTLAEHDANRKKYGYT